MSTAQYVDIMISVHKRSWIWQFDCLPASQRQKSPNCLFSLLKVSSSSSWRAIEYCVAKHLPPKLVVMAIDARSVFSLSFSCFALAAVNTLCVAYLEKNGKFRRFRKQKLCAGQPSELQTGRLVALCVKFSLNSRQNCWHRRLWITREACESI